jgi:hypothetical protein
MNLIIVKPKRDILIELRILPELKDMFFRWIQNLHKKKDLVKYYNSSFQINRTHINNSLLQLIKVFATDMNTTKWQLTIKKVINSPVLNEYVIKKTLGLTYKDLISNKNSEKLLRIKKLSFYKSFYKSFYYILLINITNIVVECYRRSLSFDYIDFPK